MFSRILLVAVAVPSLLIAAAPPWWAERGVRDSSKAADDYSAANHGQVKHVASKAFDELEAHLPGGAGPAATALVASWRSNQTAAGDFNGLNVGQLKSVAKPFYDRLIAVGYVASYPWANGGPADDFAAANTGQVKSLFSFDIRADSDADGLPNWWETRWFPSEGASATDDSDGDGLTNIEEFHLGTNPTLADTDGDGFSDGDEVANGTDANNATDFGRLERSVWTALPGTRVSDLTRTAAFAQTPTTRDYTTGGAVAPSDSGTNFGQRLRGTLRAPVSGTYRFWIASDDSGELWLGSTDSRFSKRLVAAVNGHVAAQDWDFSPSQKSVSVELVAGQRYWIEALAKQEGFSDHLAIAWQYPGQPREVIPAAVLRPPANDPSDSNDDNLPDAWTSQHGVVGGEYGDSDNDGLSNFDEYRYGTDPVIAAGVPGKLSRDVWYRVQDAGIVRLTQDQRFLAASPDFHGLWSGSAFPYGDRANDWGQRLRGTVTVQATGAYTFYIAADDNAELWLSTDDRKFQKKRIAWVQGPFAYTDAGQFGKYVTQKSAPVTLTAGGKYYIEILHTDQGGPEHVSVAWQRPGAPNIESIPAEALESFVHDSDDVDDDDLPDSWEAHHGLDTLDAGQIQSREGAFGDYDGDGLSNREEYLLGTNPAAVDTDGDSVSDFDEVHGTQTDPLTHDLGNPTDVATLTGSQATADRLGQWTTEGAEIYAVDRRGYVEYSLSVPVADVYRLELEGSANGYAENINIFDLVMSIDGESLGSTRLTTFGSAAGKTGAFTPWLTPGTHVIRIFWDNPARAKSLRIKSIRLQAFPGIDANSNGVKDWVERLLASRNGLIASAASIDSYVSPAFVEGRGPFLSMLNVTAHVGSDVSNVTAQPGPDQTWYTNIPVAATVATVVTASHESGGLVETQSIRWIPKNVVAGGSLIIRKGDSLLLTAYPTTAAVPPNNGSCVLNVGTTQYSTTPTVPVAHAFTTAGTYFVSGSFADGSQTTAGTLTVTVVDYSFTTTPHCWAGRARAWTVPSIPSEVELQVDSRVAFTEPGPSNNGEQTLHLQIDQNEARFVVARIGPTGPILAATRANGFKVFAAPDTYNYTVEVFPDESRLVETMIIATPVSTAVTVRVIIIAGGITFEDGTTVKDLTFDELGQSKVRFLMPASSQTANCHQVEAYQGFLLIGRY
jgi:hypothetical protein